jgi:hypothetical protein
MSQMSRLYVDIQDMYNLGMSSDSIAQETNTSVDFIDNVIRAFGDEWDVERCEVESNE